MRLICESVCIRLPGTQARGPGAAARLHVARKLTWLFPRTEPPSRSLCLRLRLPFPAMTVCGPCLLVCNSTGMLSMQRRTDTISVCVCVEAGRWGHRKNLIPSKMPYRFYLVDFINLWAALTDKIALIVQNFLLPSLFLPVIGTSAGAFRKSLVGFAHARRS